MRSVPATLLLSLVLACSSGEAGDAPDAGPDGGVAARPFRLVVPSSYDGTTPTPLVVLFHGYGANGSLQDAYFGMSAAAERHGTLLATPDGTVNAQAMRFWNATDACCDFQGSHVDDVAYFEALVDDVARRYRVNPKRVYAVGHSNGGFMAHRLACDASARVAAVVSLAGAGFWDRAKCQPAQRVAVLQAHGDADAVVLYGGGVLLPGFAAHPSAVETVSAWAARNGCAAVPVAGSPLDLSPSLPGDETIVARHPGCAGGAAELWTIRGGSHTPHFDAAWGDALFGFLLAHPKP